MTVRVNGRVSCVMGRVKVRVTVWVRVRVRVTGGRFSD